MLGFYKATWLTLRSGTLDLGITHALEEQELAREPILSTIGFLPQSS